MSKIWQILYEAKLTQGNEPSQKDLNSPWYVKTLLAFTGWLAALFVLGFLATALHGLLDNKIALMIFGIFMIGLAYTIFKKEVNDFVEHLGLAISVAGQILIYIAMVELLRESSLSLWLTLMLFQVFLALNIPHYIHRFFSAFIATYASLFVLALLGMPYALTPLFMLIIAYIWLNEFHFKEREKMQAIGYGILLAFLYMQSVRMSQHTPFLWSYNEGFVELWFPSWLGALLSGVIFGFVLMHIVKQYQKTLHNKLKITLLLAVILLVLATLKIPTLLVSIFILILGFNHSNRVFLAVGVASFLFSISSYYYFLNITLLEKAGHLFIFGLLLLLLRWVVFHVVFKKEAKNV